MFIRNENNKNFMNNLVIQKKSYTFAHAFRKEVWYDPLAQLVEHNTFNVGVMGSSPMRITSKEGFSNETLFCFVVFRNTIGRFLKKRTVDI